MGCQEIFAESNEEVKERYDLVAERIASVGREENVSEKYRDYFTQAARGLCFADEILRKKETGGLEHLSLQEWKEVNERMYQELFLQNYDGSYANPKMAAQRLGDEFGGMLCFLYAELRAAPLYALEGRKKNMAILFELFVEIYNCFEREKEPEKKEIEQILYWFFYDYCEVFSEDKVRDLVEPDYDFFTNIVMESDLSDLRYLYRYGECIGRCEIETAEFLNSLQEEEIQSMADTMTEGFRIGYENLGKDLSKKETVCMEYPVGFERIVRAAIRNFEKLGLKTTIYRNPVSSFGFGGGIKRGCYTKSVNKQFEFDHKENGAFYLDKAFGKRRVETMKAAFEKYKRQAKRHAGPAVIEIFGEIPFEPVIKPEAPKYEEWQNELLVDQMNCLSQMTNAYIPGDERSFTIIAYPIPAIGPEFKEIFRETVKVNTLDSMRYRSMQQKMIDRLDQAVKVHITGKGENKTDLWVALPLISDPEKETSFENCVADVNIPVGEVFTTPALKGTFGRLHVTDAYLNGLKYKNLTLEFKDGMIVHFSCTNFESEEENQKFLYENLLRRHKTLPMGEFAIGTNTTAYRMARDYGIADKLPVLIAEKTGPHFAIGDTCYSHAEDTKVFNPDGKEMIARDNERSILRKEDVSKAYFNCHTDITIPYDELDRITAAAADGSCVDLIRDGKFVLEGTEELNLPLR